MTREPIYAAVFAKAQTLKSASAVKTASRLLLHWGDVKPAQMPALFQALVRETPLYVGKGTTVHGWTIDLLWYVYVHRGSAESPQTVLAPVLDAIEAAWSPVAGIETLGGLVASARIAGPIEVSEGTLGELEVAWVPIQVVGPA